MTDRDAKGRFIKGHIVNKGKHHTLGTRWSKPMSIESRKKISAGMTGKTNAKGKKWTNERKEKFSLLFRGKNGHNWKGGIEHINRTERGRIEFRLWRESVFNRDNWTCQKCRIRGGTLNPHHIRNFSEYPELRFCTSNGITLCKKCHVDFHKTYGWEKNTEEQTDKFIKSEERSLWIP